MSKNKTLVKQNAVLIGTSVMLDECIEIAIKQFNKVFVITKDKKIKKKFKKKIKLIKLNQLKSVRSDYLFSILNDQILPFKTVINLSPGINRISIFSRGLHGFTSERKLRMLRRY